MATPSTETENTRRSWSGAAISALRLSRRDSNKTEPRQQDIDLDRVSAQAGSQEAALLNHKSLTWWQGSIVLIAETVSLGILSLPSVLATVGLIPGIILILVLGGLSTYSGLMLGEFHKVYPHVQNFGDAVEVIGRPYGLGRVFQEVFGWSQVIFQVFVAGSHLLTWTICLNTLTDSTTCTTVWAAVGLGVFWILNLPRTLKWTSWMSVISCVSITLASLITVGDVALYKPIGSMSITMFRATSFVQAFSAVNNVSVAFTSHSCFFAVISEFKKPEDWPKALALLQVAETTLYLIAAIVIYVYAGPDAPSPALSAAHSIVMRKVIWAIAIPTIVIAGVVYAHVAARYVFVRMFRGTKHMERRTKLSTAAWVLITFSIWVVAMIIASSIPVFNSLLSLVGALFVSWFSYGLPGLFWLWMYRGRWFTNHSQNISFAANVTLVITGFMLCVLGLWSSTVLIINDDERKPWSCMTNAAEAPPEFA